jgi:hypothetical protein
LYVTREVGEVVILMMMMVVIVMVMVLVICSTGAVQRVAVSRTAQRICWLRVHRRMPTSEFS